MSEKLKSILWYAAGILMVGGVVVMFCGFPGMGISIAAFGLATGLFQGRIEADKNFARICYAIVSVGAAIGVFYIYPDAVRVVAAVLIIAGIWGLIFAVKK